MCSPSWMCDSSRATAAISLRISGRVRGRGEKPLRLLDHPRRAVDVASLQQPSRFLLAAGHLQQDDLFLHLDVRGQGFPSGLGYGGQSQRRDRYLPIGLLRSRPFQPEPADLAAVPLRDVEADQHRHGHAGDQVRELESSVRLAVEVIQDIDDRGSLARLDRERDAVPDGRQ